MTPGRHGTILDAMVLVAIAVSHGKVPLLGTMVRCICWVPW